MYLNKGTYPNLLDTPHWQTIKPLQKVTFFCLLTCLLFIMKNVTTVKTQ